jgi:hypothetical protein
MFAYKILCEPNVLLNIKKNKNITDYNNTYFDHILFKRKTLNFILKILPKINSDWYYFANLTNHYSLLASESLVVDSLRNKQSRSKVHMDNNSINIYADGKLIVKVPEYNMFVRFFFLWEIFNNFDLGIKNSKDIDVLYICNILNFNEYLYAPTEIPLCIAELRKRYLKKNMKDNYTAIYINDNKTTGSNAVPNYLKQTGVNIKEISIDLIQNILKITGNNKYDIIIKVFYYYGFDSHYYRTILNTKYFINEVSSAILCLKHGGSMIILSYLPRTDLLAKLIYMVGSYFENFAMDPTSCNDFRSDRVYYIFSKLIKPIDTDLFTKLYDLSKEMIESTTDKPKEIVLNESYSVSTKDTLFVDNIFDFDLPKDFIDVIKSFNNTMDKKIFTEISKIDNLHSIFDILDDDQKAHFIMVRRNEQIKFAKEWCIKFDMPIHKFYQSEEKTPVLYDKRTEFMKYFPDRKNVDKRNLMMTDIGMYSITPYWEAKEMVDIIRKNIDGDLKNMTITEPNGGMGGNTLAFSEAFNKVTTVEYSNLHCDILKNNIDVYNCENVEVLCWDYSEIFKKLKQDIIFMDPPWGGPAYKYVKKLNLYIGKYSVEDILNKITVKLAVIKAPFNFDIDYFKKHVSAKSIEVIKVRNYLTIVAKF